MDIGNLRLELISSRNWAAYALAFVEVLAACQKLEAAAC